MAQSARQSITFATLPLEIRGMILLHIIRDIDVDHPKDLSRWSYRDQQAAIVTSTEIARASNPYRFRSNVIPRP